MVINFKIKLRCLHGGKNFSIITNSQKHEIESDCDLEFTVAHEYRDQSFLKLFSIAEVTEGLNQRVTIMEIKKNQKQWRDFFSYCEFRVRGNRFVEDTTQSPSWELCFNGDLGLNIDLGRGQFDFSPYYRSKKREDFFFNNRHQDAGPDHHYWCSEYCYQDYEGKHIGRWKNIPYLPQYKSGQKYDYGCFGCSITRGSGLIKGSEWPALMGSELGSVINLAEDGSGVDSIFLNLLCGLREFGLGAVVVLWPDPNRRCKRWRVDDNHMRYPLTVGSKLSLAHEESIWFDPLRDRWGEMMLDFQDRCISGWMEHRAQRIISRAMRLLCQWGIPSWHSSWSDKTYSYLQSLGLGSALLPPFPTSDRGALDGKHPSADQQRSWYEMIKKQIKGQGQ